jgi:hypothetical protein
MSKFALAGRKLTIFEGLVPRDECGDGVVQDSGCEKCLAQAGATAGCRQEEVDFCQLIDGRRLDGEAFARFGRRFWIQELRDTIGEVIMLDGGG